MSVTAKPMLQQLVAYHYQMNERLYLQCGQLTHAAFVADTAYSLGSLRNHMVHLMSVDMAWLNGLQGHPRDHFQWLDPADFATFADAHAYAQGVSTAVLTALEAWDDADLAVIPAGFRETRWQVLMHLVTHGVDHRAQMLRLLHEHDAAATFPQDFIMYVWAQLADNERV